MAYQAIGLGSVADDGTGDNLREGADKVNDNFVELYTLLGNATTLSSGISSTATVITLASPVITGPTISGVVGGTQTSATITTLTSATITGLSSLVVGNLSFVSGSITDSSGAIDFGNENLVTTGTFGAGTTTLGALTCGTITSTGATIVFEGATDDAYETTLTVADPTADRTITFPNITGTVITDGDTNTVSGTMVRADTIVESNMAANSIDSDSYVDGSIRTEHLAANSVDSGHYVDGSIRTAHIADNQITGAKLNPSLVAGDIIYASATDTIARLGKGSDDEVLTLASGLPSWSSIEAFPAGTLMLFQQTSAPTGWTKITSHNDKALRVVSGTASTGGSVAFETAFASQTVAGTISSSLTNGSVSGTVGNTTLSTTQIPAHTHSVTGGGSEKGAGSGINTSGDVAQGSIATSSTGGSAVHTHGWSGSISGGSVSSSFSGTAINLNVQFVDVIIASKD